VTVRGYVVDLIGVDVGVGQPESATRSLRGPVAPPVFWSTIAMIPAKDGANADVP